MCLSPIAAKPGFLQLCMRPFMFIHSPRSLSLLPFLSFLIHQPSPLFDFPALHGEGKGPRAPVGSAGCFGAAGWCRVVPDLHIRVLRRRKPGGDGASCGGR
ncbi:uncharacterized protein K452DRAFT_53538 [Aplosporella prunicola CBS 121167]|uniref:Uncharacterized protein n=1 Tax=Aplosporella prunicola CBS 121167 TaxID=1176127 RepID=A0A6A6B7Z2_9PEZI|nr:uncharacterized protein K452DRAFT_53538 [Aplosporella prunicola CBS 121167]KAF2140259.1 hypothetical protein K452DRAFT_53538 [Aplosporella prunicola CBS 121167]